MSCAVYIPNMYRTVYVVCGILTYVLDRLCRVRYTCAVKDPLLARTPIETVQLHSQEWDVLKFPCLLHHRSEAGSCFYRLEESKGRM